MRWIPTAVKGRALRATRAVPWRTLLACSLFLAGMTAIGWGFGIVFLGTAQSPERAAVGFAIWGLAGLCFIGAGRLIRFGQADS